MFMNRTDFYNSVILIIESYTFFCSIFFKHNYTSCSKYFIFQSTSKNFIHSFHFFIYSLLWTRKRK